MYVRIGSITKAYDGVHGEGLNKWKIYVRTMYMDPKLGKIFTPVSPYFATMGNPVLYAILAKSYELIGKNMLKRVKLADFGSEQTIFGQNGKFWAQKGQNILTNW